MEGPQDCFWETQICMGELLLINSCRVVEVFLILLTYSVSYLTYNQWLKSSRDYCRLLKILLIMSRMALLEERLLWCLHFLIFSHLLNFCRSICIMGCLFIASLSPSALKGDMTLFGSIPVFCNTFYEIYETVNMCIYTYAIKSQPTWARGFQSKWKTAVVWHCLLPRWSLIHHWPCPLSEISQDWAILSLLPSNETLYPTLI